MKRYVKAAQMLSQGSFDFTHDGNYDSTAIESAICRCLENNGCTCEGVGFYEVDYSGYPEFKNNIVSQCSFDFKWDIDYDGDKIASDIIRSLDKLGYDVIGGPIYESLS